MKETAFDIVIVGAGVVGLSLALGLEERKFKVAIIESDILPKSFEERKAS